MYFRSDMAKELRDRYMKEYSARHKGEPDGIRYTEKRCGKTALSEVEIYNEEGARALCRPVGRYVTVSVKNIWQTDEETFYSCADTLAEIINSMKKGGGCTLAVGLGNRYVTADALGPLSVKHIIATHHISGTDVCKNSGFGDCAVLSPGVLSQTGIEAAEQIKAAVNVIKPSLIIIIDSLAAASTETLSSSVQVTDTGVSPGSGVGNDRGELSEKTLGVPIVAVGVPTVIDAAALVRDITDEDCKRLKGMYVCPKDSDRSVSSLARLIGCAVNRVCHKGVPYGDMEFI